jgi:hypothetical protein
MGLMFRAIEGTLAVPHELLHILGFRLVGKRCLYRWGDLRAVPVGPLSRRAALVGGLFPFAVFLSLQIVFLGLSGVAFALACQVPPPSRSVSDLFWTLLFVGLSMIAGLYVGGAAGDLQKVFRLLRQKSVDDPEPQSSQ